MFHNLACLQTLAQDRIALCVLSDTWRHNATNIFLNLKLPNSLMASLRKTMNQKTMANLHRAARTVGIQLLLTIRTPRQPGALQNIEILIRISVVLLLLHKRALLHNILALHSAQPVPRK